ncbi:hydroxylamine reductase [Prevotella bivia]|uniref:hydroxylamine reductase n=1 Tax=Prevotella bivia TaxID=28125 RepID=UPI00065FF1C5|nr:hydroxylamine reductase [Prevotella bivia]MDU2329505.1 hydroxylamine reductase [Prevotella bivia]WIL17899.1 hydroxylamine reductase [Prevotella bivia]
MTENKMFCFQCQETAKGTGCTIKGVCGKEAETSKWQDLLLSVVRGVGTIQHTLGENASKEVADFLVDALFSTITNANFDDQSILNKVDTGIALKKQLLETALSKNITFPNYQEVHWGGEKSDYSAEGEREGVLRNENADLRSLKELTVLGLKGIAAYYDHAARLGEMNEEIIAFICKALATITAPDADMETLLGIVLETGKYGVDVMALLDKANTETYGNPELTRVNIGVGKKPGILISGHDLKDIEDLLIQTEGTGIDVYTHGEMLPAHYYPQLKKYKHLVGNYGNAWWKQKEEFASFNGPIVFTTNCIVPPAKNANYAERVFTTNSTGFPGWKHIATGEDGKKDFAEVIALAKTCDAPQEIESGEIVGGFAHAQVFALADQVVEAVKSGAIRKFVVMSGCDGRMKSRNYYEEFAKALPKDVVILTSGCAKYKYNKLNLGDINGIPRVLDAGQCNDSYSWAVVALKLKEIFGANDINDLPIFFNIAWYEQKAVIVLLALLYLGVKNIHIGPTLPAFVSEGVLQVLVDNFGLAGNSTVEEDIQKYIL